jgi:hypothetical protein
MKRMVKDPLFHFLLIGAAMFGLYGLLEDESAAGKQNVINVTESDIDQLKAFWQKQWQRPPTREELDNLVEGRIREQVLYREALALGMEKDDTIVRRRLVQKMDFLVADVSLPKEPDPGALQEYYQSHLDRYREPENLSFTHIYFSIDQRGERVEQEARAVLETLKKTGAQSTYPDEYGDRFMLKNTYINRSVDEIARDFGREFADRILKLSEQQWQGPVISGYGMHLVYISDVKASRVHDFQEVKEQVKNDYLFDLRREANSKIYQKFRERYEINVVPYS